MSNQCTAHIIAKFWRSLNQRFIFTWPQYLSWGVEI